MGRSGCIVPGDSIQLAQCLSNSESPAQMLPRETSALGEEGCKGAVGNLMKELM